MSSARRFHGGRYAVVLLFLLAMLPVTWAARQGAVRAARLEVEDRQFEAIEVAFEKISGDFEAQQRDLLKSAKALASDSRIVEALSTWTRGTRLDENLVRAVAGLQLPERTAVEIYDPSPRLVVWNGYSLPLDDAPSRPRFLEGVLTAIATDGSQRTALVLWWPVRDGRRVVGAVRIAKLMELQVPVQNRYLRRYSQARTWTLKTRLPVTVLYDAPFDDELPLQGEVRLLTGIDGSSLGRVFIDTPTQEAVVGRVRARFDLVLSFWATLIFFWIATGAWMAYRVVDPRGSPARFVFRFATFAIVWWGVRFALAAIDIPARYQPGKAPLNPLFDPQHLASSAGFGLIRSSGDLLLSSFFAFVFAFAFADFARRLRRARVVRYPEVIRTVTESWKYPGTWIFGTIVGGEILGLTGLLGELSRVVILDSTLEYFARTGLIPADLVLVVFSALLIFAISFVAVGVGVCWLSVRALAPDGRWVLVPRVAGGVLAGLIVVILAYLIPGVSRWVPWHAAVLLGSAVIAVAAAGMTGRREGLSLLTLRNVLPSIFVLTAILYPLFYRGMEIQREMRMVDAAESFEEERDPRVMYGLDQVLQDALRADRFDRLLRNERSTAGSAVDSVATSLLRNSFLASLGSYETSITVYSPEGVPVGRYYEVDPRLPPSALERMESDDLGFLRTMMDDRGGTEPLLEPLAGEEPGQRFRYRALAALDDESVRLGWVVVRAEPRTLLREAGTPFPRVLVPAGFFGNLQSNLSLAQFRQGTLVRSSGDDFGRYRLSEEIARRLAVEKALWTTENIRGKEFLAYYQVQRERDPVFEVPIESVVAVRIASINIFDHLYNLLRLTFGGLIVGFPVYLTGIVLRRRHGLLPAPSVRFRDKILNAFFGVGVITVAAMGVVGMNVVTGDNEREIESWLRQHLDRVERTVALDARGGEMTYRVLERLSVDSLAARVGLDLNLYRGDALVASSRPQLIRDRLIEPRLPIGAYEALYVDGFKFADVQERLGRFVYTVGFRSIPDEQGRPHYVISVPTLPEQERIEEERARTVAYLFGALLLLVLVVMVTASLLANALTRPIGRLREGIEAVSRGRFNRIRPLDTRDEIAELVDSFNMMQGQLSESRRRLAQQERQLAWREMARQVAHEIKNPLTPMKLSVQHLRRSFEQQRAKAGESFSGLFDRITSTLTEQIDALARIANEFSSFARMPRRIEEIIDLNSVVEEAAVLMQAEVDFDIHLDLEDHPLILRADREEVRRIFINLLKNAIQSIPDDRVGAISISTRLEARRNDSPAQAYCCVQDNGSGISEEVRSKIFVPNFSTKTSGTGLGLAIVRKSVEDLQGKIGFEANDGDGTSFWIRLPLTVEEPTPFPSVEPF